MHEGVKEVTFGKGVYILPPMTRALGGYGTLRHGPGAYAILLDSRNRG
jgi:hypothetical protein